MVSQITKGIKISVQTKDDGIKKINNTSYYLFSYTVTIENKSSNTIKLTARFWKIFDSLNQTEIVSGEGVVGQTPTLKPNDTYVYNSACFLVANIGAMTGFYTMIDTNTFEQFKVGIPTFQLTSQAILN